MTDDEGGDPDQLLADIHRLMRAAAFDSVIARLQDGLAMFDVRFHLLHAEALMRLGRFSAAARALAEHRSRFRTISYFNLLLLLACHAARRELSAQIAELVNDVAAEQLGPEQLRYYVERGLGWDIELNDELIKRHGGFGGGLPVAADFGFGGPQFPLSALSVMTLVSAAAGDDRPADVRIPAATTIYEAADSPAASVSLASNVSTAPYAFVELHDATVYCLPNMDGLVQRSDGTFVGNRPHGVVNPHGNPLVRDCMGKLYLNSERVAAQPRHRLPGTSLLPFRLAGIYYFHFVLETLCALYRGALQYKDATVLLPDYDGFFARMRRSVHDEAIEAIAPEATRFKRLPHGIYVCESLLVPKRWDYGDDCVGRLLTTGSRPSARQVLYVTRRRAGDRRIRNEAEVIETVRRRYGEVSVVELESYGFREQVALFQSASVVVAPHGGGLANLVFARPDTVVVEILLVAQDAPSPPAFWHISFLRQLRYTAYVPAVVQRQNDDYEVDVAAFRACLDTADSPP